MTVQLFVQPTGLAVQTSGEPGDLFSLFFTPDIIRNIVQETNRYAAQCLVGTSHTWNTDKHEIHAYFRFYILMGLVREPEIRDYWSTGPTFHYSPIADRISRKRFEEISRYLHFIDKEHLPARDSPNYHRLQHVKPVIDALRERFSVVVWQDKRPVLSTLSQPGETVQVSQRERDVSRVEVSCPSAILTYTKYMDGVDLGDQLHKYYCVCLK